MVFQKRNSRTHKWRGIVNKIWERMDSTIVKRIAETALAGMEARGIPNEENWDEKISRCREGAKQRTEKAKTTFRIWTYTKPEYSDTII